MKLALVSSDQKSTWRSCVSITDALKKSYSLLSNTRIKHFDYRLDMKSDQVWKTAIDIKNFAPDTVVFIDHQPSPASLLVALSEIYGSQQLPFILIHVFGGLPLSAWQWLDAEEALSHMRIRFLCASVRQKLFLSRLLSKSNRKVGLCPFPVNTEIFNNNTKSSLGASFRRRHNISPNAFVVSYAGRISVQKNIILMISEFLKWRRSHPEAVLCIAGSFDHLVNPYFGYRNSSNIYFRMVTKHVEQLDIHDRAAIQFLGELDQKELSAMYRASDLYVSLSVHHDEDFGMAPAEALCCGTPVLLTDWAGYSSFHTPDIKGLEYASNLVPVVLSKYGPQIIVEAICRAFETAYLNRTKVIKNDIANESQNKFSIENVSKKINRELDQLNIVSRFGRFNDSFFLLARHLSSQNPFSGKYGVHTDYHRLYGAYLRDGLSAD